MQKIRKFLTEYLFVVFVVLALVLYVQKGLVTGVYAFGEPRNRIMDLLLGNTPIWIILLISLISYFFLAVFDQKTNCSISILHVSIVIIYFLPFTWWAYQVEYSILNACVLLSNLSYSIYLHLKSRELPAEELLDA